MSLTPPSPSQILIVDSQKAPAKRLALQLEAHGFTCLHATSLRDARAALASGNGIELVLLDTRLENEDGMDLLRNRPRNCPPIVVVTDDNTGKCTIEVMRWGAYDHLSKAASEDSLMEVVKRATLRGEELSPWSMVKQEMTVEPIFGKTEEMHNLQKQVGLAASSDATVLITGETGTGKDLVAQALHNFSSRSSGPLVPVNCATMPPELLESELFGHAKGAFTGAISARTGRFQEADGGTLFLDEIGDMPPVMQVKLLRAIQQKEIRPLGADHAVRVDVRIIGATHRKLVDLVHSGQFRQDLFFRLNVINLRVPALREHRKDIPLLADYFLQKHAGGGTPKRLTVSAMSKLVEYDWPGNIRELENMMQTISVMLRSPQITADDLPFSQEAGSADNSFAIPSDWAELPYRDAMAKLERGLLEEALKKSAGNRSAAARKLGLYRQHFYAKLRSFGLL